MSTLETENTQKQETPQRRVEFNFPLLIIRTKRFSAIFEKLGTLRASRYISWLLLSTVPFVAGVALYLMVNSLINILNNPAVGQVARELGPGAILLLPGINPMLPIVYGWIAIVVAIVVHEGAHGIIARNIGFNVKSSGLLFFLVIPIGAFVDVDEDQIKIAKARPALKVMAAGVGANTIIGVACLIGLLLIVGGLTPAINGVYVDDVTEGMPAQTAGLLPKDVLISIDNTTITNSTQLRTILDNKTAGDTVQVTVARGDSWQYQFSTIVNLTISENRTVMGINSLDPEARLENYKTFSIDRLTMYIIPPTLAEGLVPYSDFLGQFYSSPLGPQWAIAANTLFWLWFVNFNLAIFNALPLYPLDGGRIFNITLKRVAGNKLSEKRIRTITLGATAIIVVLVLLVTVVPFIL
ncbi:MAG TPA: M50 family metallopeptidase [Candidatus Deferrimicrobiaceae bacterium]|nr:M50 family metallopeptidase [Candidatus Deferrimicrobiaceae bacterium]